ncbi:uncharacterized protein LOC119838209 [Zerene cesonia]|uniref:uncharacterized protein LOC119838209 n=1 Tax=Zerene cesonia TaxID=33412 RepID=UPI0018E57141|nr:uncharacterized protein LOC119838209 [Zerene cesonia]
MEIRVILSLFLLSFGSCSIIIPEELPSLLSVAYSNIPPIKKGTDSRVGFGFAFGNHADFQVMLELGPQTNTLPLNGQAFPTNTKRQAPNPPEKKINKNREKFLQTDAGKYLQSWAQRMKNPQPVNKPIKPETPNLEDSMVELVKNAKGEYEIHQPSPGNMPKYVLDSLKKLYGEKREEAKKMAGKREESNRIGEKRSEEEVKKITEDLSNVDLD